MSLNIERSNLRYRPKGNAKFEIRNSECENQNWGCEIRNVKIKTGNSEFGFGIWDFFRIISQR